MAFLSKNKLILIDEDTHIAQQTDPICPIWELFKSGAPLDFSPSIAQSILWFDFAKVNWRVLQTRFAY